MFQFFYKIYDGIGKMLNLGLTYWAPNLLLRKLSRLNNKRYVRLELSGVGVSTRYYYQVSLKERQVIWSLHTLFKELKLLKYLASETYLSISFQ